MNVFSMVVVVNNIMGRIAKKRGNNDIIKKLITNVKTMQFYKTHFD